ncbi:MAG: RND transporter [Planctomycetota bacterium]
MRFYKMFGMSAMLFASILTVTGCAGDKPVSDNDTTGATSTTTSHGDHSGWWCVEHAIPEEECSMCSSTSAKEFRENDDWCEEHNRAESQCFVCDPSRAEKYAKLYEAKYGKQPPAATE